MVEESNIQEKMIQKMNAYITSGQIYTPIMENVMEYLPTT